MVLDFFESKPKILEALINKNSQPQTYNNPTTINPTGYYSMTGSMGLWLNKLLYIEFLLWKSIEKNKEKNILNSIDFYTIL